nr:MAG TPA: hypothetical protein [Caudoviricetes sp.]
MLDSKSSQTSTSLLVMRRRLLLKLDIAKRQQGA